MANYNSAYTGAQIDAAVGAVASKADDTAVVHNTGNETIDGVKTFSSFPVTPSSVPTANYQVANKKYIDDKVKTDVPVGAKFTDTVYTHPASHPPSIIAQDASNRFVSDAEKSAWNSKAAGTHSHAQSDVIGLSTSLSGKVDKVTGKGLSTEDYTTTEKNKLAGIEAGANNYTHPSTHSADIITDGTTNKAFTATEKNKLAGIEAGAQANTVTSVAGKTGAVTLAKSDVELGNVDNVKQATKTEHDALDARVTSHEADGTQHGKSSRFVVGTSTAGWTAADCDYLCDGTADQTEINAAITALPATGGEVVILDGTYNITAKIDVTKDNVSIRGNGNATILKRMYNSGVVEGVITLTDRSGCKIANLQIEGNKTSYTYDNNYGIYLNASSNNTVTSNTCNNNSTGIYVRDSSNNNTVTSNTCNSNNYGIYLITSSNNTVTGNTCNNNSRYGIYLASSSSNNTVVGNTCNNSDRGIYLNNSSNNTVTGNTCNNNNYGIYLTASSNNSVTGNTCNNNGSGIYLSYSSSNNTVIGNTCIRGTGLATDYTTSQHTIRLYGTDNSYNLIAMNNCMGKAVTNGGGTGNTLVNNKFDAT